MKIVFFGTPDYVAPILTAIEKRFGGKSSGIVAVVTQRPKPTGRKKLLTYSPVDAWAHKRKMPVFYSPLDLVKEGIKADLGVLAAYGEIVPKDAIKHFPQGILNIHPSLLPRYRGASPIQAAIALGEKETGVTIIKIDEQLDHGPIVSRFKEELFPDDTLESARTRLFINASEVLIELIKPYIQGKIKPREQNHGEATYTGLVEKSHGFIPPKYLKEALEGKTVKGTWSLGFIKSTPVTPSPALLEAFVRALYPWPGAFSEILVKRERLRIKILKARLDGEKLVLDTVQLEGKSPVSFSQFKEGYPEAGFE